MTNETAEAGFGYVGTGTYLEDLCYFYHSDHLGSTSYMTDLKGNISQFVGYMPFGEAFIEQHGSYDTPYKFNGKELDGETGLMYFGARYLDGMSSIWYGVDVMAEKYPMSSPYVFCNNNPIVFVDPDGREIWIAFDVTNKNGSTSIQKVQYKGGELYGVDGKTYTGGNEYATKVLGDLNQLSKDNNEISGRVTTLKDSKEIHIIKMTDNPEAGNSNSSSRGDLMAGKPTGSTTKYNPDKGENIIGGKRAPRAGLAHELVGHGWDADQGKKNFTETDNGIPMYEVNAVNMENRARAAAGNEKKTTYGQRFSDYQKYHTDQI